MLATAELRRPEGALGPVETIWHLAADPNGCNGDCDYHPIACSALGISMPGGIQEVPDDLDEPHQRWCTDCRTGDEAT